MSRNQKKTSRHRAITKDARAELSARVRNLRNLRGWSQAQMAEKFGLSSAAIAMWETENNYPNGAALKLLEIYEKLDL